MSRRWSVVTGVLIALLLAPQPARAWDWWDWAQEFSGPGPFTTGSTLNTMLSCLQTVHRSNTDDRVVNPVWCTYFDHRSFDNTQQPDEPWGKVELDMYEMGVSKLFQNGAVDLGFGAGIMDIKEGTHKWILTVPRVVISPAILFSKPGALHDLEGRDNRAKNAGKRLLKVVKFYAKLNVIVGELTTEDFGGDPSIKFQTSGERIASAGFILDGIELYRAVRASFGK